MLEASPTSQPESIGAVARNVDTANSCFVQNDARKIMVIRKYVACMCPGPLLVK
jgi:hypothetical protein